ncbi:helix-turn-helix domain-containing protein [Tabrizicola fusiformis]|uniref:helix-turn-helix domain-containing protein n=1 Tax=Tabrizicola sp. SY72 TaxID=2741673 RepID=UPI001571E156|nr:helix-turn-helix domain-containing protein [Tabrizicola sp. SY72]NTT85726.1 helix-turn-helix domain-containing protein [Tabrizicola sp. SY72]
MGRQTIHEYFEPDSFCRTVRDMFGAELLRQLRLKLGGLDIRFPKPPSVMADDHFLVVALGSESAHKLAQVFSDEPVYIPKLSLEERYLTLVDEGLTTREIAQRLDKSERQVRRYLSGLGIKISPLQRPRKAGRPRASGQFGEAHALIAAE